MSFVIALLIALVLMAFISVISQRSRTPLHNKQMEIEKIDRLLPQTQCGDCGYPGCRPYAEAIVMQRADINRCLPGGNNTIKNLSRLTGKETRPLYKPEKPSNQVAIIDESVCIGCVKCIKACPVDAIIGAPKLMHNVIYKYCTGCELCIAPCPVDCIQMVSRN